MTDEVKPVKTTNWRSLFSTVMGGVVAVAIAWSTIEWDHFELTKNNIMKLCLSGLVALGGWMTTLEKKQ